MRGEAPILLWGAKTFIRGEVGQSASIALDLSLDISSASAKEKKKGQKRNRDDEAEELRQALELKM